MAEELLQVRLPLPWNYGITSDGRVFFVNEDDHTTTWLHPERNHPVLSGLTSSPDLPRGWERCHSKDKIPYYIDHVNERTTFRHPVSGEINPAVSMGHDNATASKREREENMDSARKQSKKQKQKDKTIPKGPEVRRDSDAPVTRKGWLHKMETSGPLKSWKKKWCVLTDYCLFFYKGEEEGISQGSILLPSYKVSMCSKGDGINKKFAFKAEHRNIRSTYFAADNLDDMTGWIDALNLASILQKDPNLQYEYNNNQPKFSSEADAAGFGPSPYNPGSGIRESLNPADMQHDRNQDPRYQESLHSSPRDSHLRDRNGYDDPRERQNPVSLNEDSLQNNPEWPDRRYETPASRSEPTSYHPVNDTDRSHFPPEQQHRGPGYQEPGSTGHVDPRFDPRQSTASSQSFHTDQRQGSFEGGFGDHKSRTQQRVLRSSDPSHSPHEQQHRDSYTQRHEQSQPMGHDQRQEMMQNRNLHPSSPDRGSDVAPSSPATSQRPVSDLDDGFRPQDNTPKLDPHGNQQQQWYADRPVSRRSDQESNRNSAFYTERPVDVGRDPYYQLRNPRFNGFIPDPPTPAASDQELQKSSAQQTQAADKQIPARRLGESPRTSSISSPHGSESNRSDSMKRLQDWTKLQLRKSGQDQTSRAYDQPLSDGVRAYSGDVQNNRRGTQRPSSQTSFNQPLSQTSAQRPSSQTSYSSQSRPPQHLTRSSLPNYNQQKSTPQQAPRRKFFEPLTIDTSPPYEEKQQQSAVVDQKSPSPGRPPLPPEFREKYVEKLAETATPSTREDMLNSAEKEKRRLHEPHYFQYPDDDPHYTSALLAARQEAEEAERLAQQQYEQMMAEKQNRYKQTQSEEQAPQTDQHVLTGAQEFKIMRRQSGDYSKELEQKEKSRLDKHIANSFKRLSLGDELGHYLAGEDRYNRETSPTRRNDGFDIHGRRSLVLELEKNVSQDTGRLREDVSNNNVILNKKMENGMNYGTADRQQEEGRPPAKWTDLSEQRAQHQYNVREYEKQRDESEFFQTSSWKSLQSPKQDDDFFRDADAGSEGGRESPRNETVTSNSNDYTVTETANVSIFDRKVQEDHGFRITPTNRYDHGNNFQGSNESYERRQDKSDAFPPQTNPYDPAYAQIQEVYRDQQIQSNTSSLPKQSWPVTQQDPYYMQSVNDPSPPVRFQPPSQTSGVHNTGNEIKRSYEILDQPSPSFGQQRKDFGSGDRLNMMAIKEDPGMADSDVLSDKKLSKLQQSLQGQGLRLSIAAEDLLGKSHEELVLLLIQLRRSQSRLDDERSYVRTQLDESRTMEKEYRHRRSSGYLDTASLDEGHEQYQQLHGQSNQFETQMEVHKPLVNLVDNLVTMGSLYGGNNLMMASQYKRERLRPGQYEPPTKMLEFSRQHQEEKLIKEQEEEIRKLTEDEIELEEKLQELFELDKALQHKSINLTSLQDDREMLEKALANAKQEERGAVDYQQQRRVGQQKANIEAELLRVRQQLAESSKELETTATENAKVEQEVILLRKKIYGPNKSQSSPTMSSDGSKNRLQLERELDKVNSIMTGLSRQGEKLSTVMSAFRNSKPDLTTDSYGSPQESAKPAPYQAASPDISSVSEPRSYRENQKPWKEQPQKSESFQTSYPQYETARIDTNQMYTPRDINEADDNMKRFYGLLPKEKPKNQTVRDVKKQASERRGRDPVWRGQETEGSSVKIEVRKRSQSLPRKKTPPQADLPRQSKDDTFNIKRNKFQRNTETRKSASERLFPASRTASSTDPVRRLSNIVTPRPFSPASQSQTSKLNEPLNTEAVYTPKQSTMPWLHKAPVTTAIVKPMSQTFQPSTPSQKSMEKLKARRNQRSRFMTISSSQPAKMETPSSKKTQGYSAAGDLISGRHHDDVPELTKSETVKELTFDDKTIDRQFLFLPEKVEIPERYVPESDDESLSPVEKQEREERGERIRRMLARQSLQEWRTDELLGNKDYHDGGDIHQELAREQQRREQVLDIRHSLAREVTQKSKEQAEIYQRHSGRWSSGGWNK